MRYDYACKILENQGYEIYLDNHNRILDRNFPHTFLDIKTEFEKDQAGFMQVVDIDEYLERIDNYADFVNRFNFKVLALNATGARYKRQRKKYKIVRADVADPREITKFSQNHFILIDWYNNRLRGVGKFFEGAIPNSIKGEWIPLHKKPVLPKKEKSYKLNFQDMYDSFQKDLESLMPEKTKREFFTIPESVLGISQEGYIVTYPKPDNNNPPFNIVYGSTGTGKSTFLHGLEDGFYGKFGLAIANVNDIKNETWTRCKTWNNSHWMNQDLLRFGERSIPLPAVYLYPTTKQKYDKYYYNEIGFDVSLPFRKLLTDEALLQVNKAWQMSSSGAELIWKNLIWDKDNYRKQGLIYQRNADEVLNYIKNHIKNSSSRDKILRIMQDIISSKLTDISTNASSRWILKDDNDEQIADTPWNIAMLSNLVPYINTKGIRNEIWYPLWLRFVIFDIMNFADRNKKQVHIFLDEVAPILRHKETAHIAIQAIRECRASGVGMTMVNHYSGDMPADLEMHCHYQFIFRTGDKDLQKRLKQTLGKKVNELPRLKPFQCYAIGKFKLYDSDGRSWYVNKPIKIIKTKPPNSRHYGGIENAQ